MQLQVVLVLATFSLTQHVYDLKRSSCSILYRAITTSALSEVYLLDEAKRKYYNTLIRRYRRTCRTPKGYKQERELIILK